jgi:hypothetical protein
MIANYLNAEIYLKLKNSGISEGNKVLRSELEKILAN